MHVSICIQRDIDRTFIWTVIINIWEKIKLFKGLEDINEFWSSGLRKGGII